MLAPLSLTLALLALSASTTARPTNSRTPSNIGNAGASDPDARPIQGRQAAPTRLACAKDAIQSRAPQGVTVERADSVAQGAQYGPGDDNLGYNYKTLRLPRLCAVTATVVDSAALDGPSSYRLGLFLPEAWNGTFLAVGGYSFAGGINWADMGPGAWYNMATMSTNNGHNSAQADLSWAGGPGGKARQLDWGYRAMHGSVVAAKQLVAAFYSGGTSNGATVTSSTRGNLTTRADAAAGTIKHSFYAGCSTGGRQGLKEVQISPDSFDGALIGAPAWDTQHLMPWIQYLGGLLQAAKSGANATNAGVSGRVVIPHDFALLGRAAVAACDAIAGQEGIVDGIIDHPEACDLERIRARVQCGLPNVAPAPNCLSRDEVDTAINFIYADWRADDGAGGDVSHVGMTPGSEAGWATWLSYDTSGAPQAFNWDYDRYFLKGLDQSNVGSYAPAAVNAADTLKTSEAMDPGHATATPTDLSAFRARGGKILMYQGLADYVIPPRGTRKFFDDTVRATAGGATAEDAASFFRYFEVPGMAHCSGTPTDSGAAWALGGVGQAVAAPYPPLGYGVAGHEGDARYDALLAMVRWVEQGAAAAPDQIVATGYTAQGARARTRPICRLGKTQHFKGGVESDAANWECR